MSFEIISLMVTVFLALFGYLITYWNNIRVSKRKEKLELITKRISEFYGPLYVSTQTGEKALLSLLRKLGKESVFDKPTEKDLIEWRIWVESVFMPNNNRIEQLIVEKAYLIQEQEIPACLLDFIAHHSGLKAVSRKWANGDFSENQSVVNFPSEIQKYAADSYWQLKEKQLELIGDLKVNMQIHKKYTI
jgi:hypothetical protein